MIPRTHGKANENGRFSLFSVPYLIQREGEGTARSQRAEPSDHHRLLRSNGNG